MNDPVKILLGRSALNFLPAFLTRIGRGSPLPGASPVDDVDRDVGFTPTVNRV